MNIRAAISIILLLGTFSAFADDPDKVKPPAAWEGTAHIEGDTLAIIATNSSADTAYIRIGTLSGTPSISPVEGIEKTPRMRLSCLYSLSDYTVKILWPVKKDTTLVTGNEMMRLSISSEAICDMIRENKIQDIELVLSVLELPLIEGVVKEHDQIVRCRISIKDSKK
jgi:hypothetical protein